MRVFLLFAFLLTITAPAFAQGNTITVVNPDGTKTSIDIGPSPEASEQVTITPSRTVGADTASPPQAAKEAVKEPAQKPAPKTEAKPQAKSVVKPATKPTPAKQAAKKSPAQKDAAAQKKPDAKAQKKKPAKNAAKNTAKDKEPKNASAKAAPVPEAPRPSAQGPSVQGQRNLGPNMTPDDAIRIAVDSAPPARSVHASPVNYKGLHAYEVVFATENGNHYIYVDRETGRVVR